MALLAFVVFAIIGQALNVALCLVLDQIFSQTVGALAFVVLYMFVFVAAYRLALFFFDRDAAQEPAAIARPRPVRTSAVPDRTGVEIQRGAQAAS